VVDVVAGVHQRRGDKVAEFAAVVRAAAPDLGVGGGDEHDRAQERGVAEEDGRYLAHDLVRQLVRGQAVPAPGAGQGGLVGAHPGHAVFVDGQEQGVLAVSWPRAAGAPPSGTRSTTAASGRDPPSRC
jgi:hypothetical protein